MNTFDPRTFTYGFELEVGDVHRSLEIPASLGSWEQSERDIVNLLPPYRHVAADPLGLEPPVGGEINVYPQRTPGQLLSTIRGLFVLMERSGYTPTFCSTTHSHVHVRVPGLRDNVDALHKLSRYIGENQHTMIRDCGRFVEHADMSSHPGARAYFKYDGGRPMPDWLIDNLCKAQSFEDWIRIHCCGKDGVSRGRPLRYAINTYCMKHIDTIEFRMFRSTHDPQLLFSCISVVSDFMHAALNHGTPLHDILWDAQYVFPIMRWNPEEWEGLQRTKHPETRGKKARKLIDL